jgi:hypothetical protein
MAFLMMWLLPHPMIPIFRQYKPDRQHTGRLRKRDNFLTIEGEGAKPLATEKKRGPL